MYSAWLAQQFAWGIFELKEYSSSLNCFYEVYARLRLRLQIQIRALSSPQSSSLSFAISHVDKN